MHYVVTVTTAQSTAQTGREVTTVLVFCALLYVEMAENDEDAAADQSDLRMTFLSDYVLKTLKQKSDRWAKMISVDESRQFITDFLDKPESLILVFYQNQTGQLTPSNDFPPSSKTKSVYFIKKERSSISSQNIKSILTFGDLSYIPLEQLSSLVDDVSGHHDNLGAIVSSISS